MSATHQSLPPRPAVMGAYKPDWLEIPSGDDMAAFYPARAARREISGKVTMVCTVKADGRLSDCRIAAEAPKGEGFGQAALRLAPKFRMIPPDDLRSSAGEVTIPLVFQVPEGRSSTKLAPGDAKLLIFGGGGVAAVSAWLLVVMIWGLGRFHKSAAQQAERRRPSSP
ncbi:TonB family protein [Caulobacter sp. FWC26]|uniref:TonB family protein n=2 Tax=Caulobacter TaxID=75 RepID=UPI0007809BC9|nr:TonB family protein [Caulobacter sp. FWC26]AZS19474.1 energy transducer TonB [Caulobacter sp. FWC26]